MKEKLDFNESTKEKTDQILFTADKRKKKFIKQVREQKCKVLIYCMRYTKFGWNLECGDLR